MYGVHRNALLQAHAVNRIEHTITLLDHLSRRLENYMLQATVIIAFAVTSLSAETLEIMASYTSAFCVWKSPAVCVPLALHPHLHTIPTSSSHGCAAAVLSAVHVARSTTRSASSSSSRRPRASAYASSSSSPRLRSCTHRTRPRSPSPPSHPSRCALARSRYSIRVARSHRGSVQAAVRFGLV